MDNHDLDNAHLLIPDDVGIYIPQLFARHFGQHITSDADRAILEAGPEHSEYWETWDDVLSSTYVIDAKGLRYYLHQDGDLWAIPV